MPFTLSKTRYCNAVQCPKMLWLRQNMPEAFDDSVMNEAVLNTGSEVGDLAMGLFGEYTEVPYGDLADHLMAIHDNMRDLMIPFQKRWYYTRAMQGSYSIKYVLPALFPDDPALDYHSLDGVHNGK